MVKRQHEPLVTTERIFFPFLKGELILHEAPLWRNSLVKGVDS